MSRVPLCNTRITETLSCLSAALGFKFTSSLTTEIDAVIIPDMTKHAELLRIHYHCVLGVTRITHFDALFPTNVIS